MPRLFLAVDLDASVTASVHAMASEARRHFEALGERRRWTWVSPDQYHLTLKFFGSVPDDEVPALIMDARLALNDAESHQVEARGIGAFPRALGVSVLDPERALSDLARRLGNDPKSFVPHLTFARLKDGRKLDPETDLKPEWREKRFGLIAVREVILYQSQTLPTGPIYRAIERFPLRPGVARVFPDRA